MDETNDEHLLLNGEVVIVTKEGYEIFGVVDKVVVPRVLVHFHLLS